MIKDRAQLAAYIALTYVLIVHGGIFIHFLRKRDFYTLKFSLLLPSTWVITTFSIIIALGLWHHKRWSWLLGLVAVLVQILRMATWLFQHFSLSNLPSVGVFLVSTTLIIFLIALILPGTRAIFIR